MGIWSRRPFGQTIDPPCSFSGKNQRGTAGFSSGEFHDGSRRDKSAEELSRHRSHSSVEHETRVAGRKRQTQSQYWTEELARSGAERTRSDSVLAGRAELQAQLMGL
jgi:hypothetical protein